MDKPNVLILLAAYNGEAYIRQMIDSLLNQSYRDFHLMVSDDGSADSTPKILAEYAEKYPSRVTFFRSEERYGSAQKHFIHLLELYHDAPYIMFCDQDDVWHVDKIEKTLQAMQRIEGDSCIPALVHTDLRVVDNTGKLINASFCDHSAIDGNRLKLNQLLVQNVVTGCTMMINRSLAELVCNGVSAEDMLMHDWWIALLASCCGTAAFLKEATIDYRQHGNNSVGAKNVRSAHYLWNRLFSGQTRASLDAAAKQAGAFLDIYNQHLTDRQREIIKAMALTAGKPLFFRVRTYLRYGLLKKGFARVCGQLLGL